MTLFVCLTRHHAVMTCRVEEIELHSLSCAVDGDEGVASRPGRLSPWKGPQSLILLSAAWELMPAVGPVLLIRRGRVLVTTPTELFGLQNEPRISKQSNCLLQRVIEGKVKGGSK